MNPAKNTILKENHNPRCIYQELKKLVLPFPSAHPDFIKVLSERPVANGFTNRRLKDAIGSVIDDFKYHKPIISNIIGYDRKHKLYTYSEVYRLIYKGEVSGFDEFEMIEINGEKFRKKNR